MAKAKIKERDLIEELESIKLELIKRWEEAPQVRISNAIVKIDLTIRELKLVDL
jgi:hypothetical protein